MISIECKHGHLKRKCPYCEIEELEAENQRLREALEEASKRFEIIADLERARGGGMTICYSHVIGEKEREILRLYDILDEVKQENQQLRKVLDQLINDVLCMCSEGPDIMRPLDIYNALQADAKKARKAMEVKK